LTKTGPGRTRCASGVDPAGQKPRAGRRPRERETAKSQVSETSNASVKNERERAAREGDGRRGREGVLITEGREYLEEANPRRGSGATRV